MQYTRITNSYMSDNIVQNMLMNRSKLVDIQEEISSGKRISRASDDIVSTLSVLSSNTSLGKIEGYLRNIESARSELDTADTALGIAVDALHKTRELTIQSLNATSGQDELDIINTQIEQMIEQMKDLGNTKLGTKYIFGGLKTETSPFETPTTGEVQYTGSVDGAHARNTEIAEGLTLSINLSGDSIFGTYHTGDHDNNAVTPDTLDGQGVLKTLITLSEALQSPTADKSVIREKLNDLENDLSTLLGAQSKIGSFSARLDMTRASHEEDVLRFTKIKSNGEDVDLSKAISDLKFQESALQASLYVSAKIIQPSLMNFL